MTSSFIWEADNGSRWGLSASPTTWAEEGRQGEAPSTERQQNVPHIPGRLPSTVSLASGTPAIAPSWMPSWFAMPHQPYRHQAVHRGLAHVCQRRAVGSAQPGEQQGLQVRCQPGRLHAARHSLQAAHGGMQLRPRLPVCAQLAARGGQAWGQQAQAALRRQPHQQLLKRLIRSNCHLPTALLCCAVQQQRQQGRKAGQEEGGLGRRRQVACKHQRGVTLHRAAAVQCGAQRAGDLHRLRGGRRGGRAFNRPAMACSRIVLNQAGWAWHQACLKHSPEKAPMRAVAGVPISRPTLRPTHLLKAGRPGGGRQHVRQSGQPLQRL